MFKYVKCKKVKTEHTVLEFKLLGDSEGIELFNFAGLEDKDLCVVSLKGDDAKIDEIIKKQPGEIECKVIDYEEFRNLVKNSEQINRIREIVRDEIAKKYTLADEIALNRLDDLDSKKQDYLNYVNECRAKGEKLKKEMGY